MDSESVKLYPNKTEILAVEISELDNEEESKQKYILNDSGDFLQHIDVEDKTNLNSDVDEHNIYTYHNGEYCKNENNLDVQLETLEIEIKSNISNDSNNKISDEDAKVFDENAADTPNKTYNSTSSSELAYTLGEIKNTFQRCSDDNIAEYCKSDLVKEIRRNSLPEIYKTTPSNIILDENNKLDAVLNNKPVLSLTNVNTTKQTDNKKNISDVVKNMHGIFSYMKNAYKPMEKNISGMVQATQRNFNIAKNDFLKSEKGMQDTQKAAETISKYSTLKLCNDSERIEEALFKKCSSLQALDEKSCDVSRITNVPISDENKLVNDSDLRSNSKVPESFVDRNSMDFSIDTSDNISIQSHETGISNISLNDDQAEQNRTEFQMKQDDFPKESENISDIDHKSELEKVVVEMNNELAVLKMALMDKDAVKKNLESKLNFFMKQLETVRAERDASVVRYAVSEKNALEATKIKENALSAEQTAKREVTMITQRLRTANAEKTRATAALDMKVHELSVVNKELSKMKDELQLCDVKLKWAQSKLVSEMGAHKESTALVEKLSYQMKQVEGGSNASGPASHSQNDIDSILREKEANIILERHEKERLATRCKQLQTEIDKLKASYTSTCEEIRELRAQVQSGAAESDALRRTCSELRDQGAKDCERLAAAQARAARCDTLVTHLQQEQDASAKLTKELEAMRVLREEALAESELRIRREAELLRQSERLTAVGVKLQATCSEAEAKALALTVDNASLREAASRAASEAAEARAEAAREREGRAADARALASRAAQHARGEREALAALEAARGDIRVLSTKHASAMKELKRELHQMKKKCERYESEGKIVSHPITKLSSGSTSSLSSYDSQNHPTHISDGTDVSEIQSHPPDQQQLVERIVTLQRAAARRGEKLDFLEEHNRQLTQELQRKTRLLRNFLVATPAGALSSPASDAAKAEIGRHGGVMASVYGSQVTDETMTLELSLEINAKLQSLLEDTLLSNITLKENMDTLGDEITNLKKDRKSNKSNK